MTGTGDPLEALAFYQQGRDGVQGFMHPLLQQHYAAAAAAAAAATAAGRSRLGGAYGSLGLDGEELSLSASGAPAGSGALALMQVVQAHVAVQCVGAMVSLLACIVVAAFVMDRY